MRASNIDKSLYHAVPRQTLVDPAASHMRVRVTSRRGAAEAPARIGNIEPGTLFMPFHYGYWDNPGRMRAANELTLYEWDPVSKQPHFKYAAVRLEKVEGPPLPQPDETKCGNAMCDETHGSKK